MSGNVLVTGGIIISSMTCTVVGNLLLKIGAGHRGVGTVWPLNLLNLHTLFGAFAFCIAMVLYIMVLKRTALNLAQSIFALQFVLVILAAHLILDEPIGPYRWMGIALIAVGLLVIAFSPSAASA